MSLYHCDACGSPDVIAEKENGRYSYQRVKSELLFYVR